MLSASLATFLNNTDGHGSQCPCSTVGAGASKPTQLAHPRMGDDQQGRGALQRTAQGQAQGRGVEGGKALVEDDDVGALQQGARQVETALLAVGEPPAGVADHLQQPGSSAVQV